MVDDLNYLMNKPIGGIWWRSDEPDAQLDGVLELDETLEGVLKLKGPRKSFASLTGATYRSMQFTLFGTSERGTRKWTLFACGRKSGPHEGTDPEEIVDATFYTNDILMGHHVESDELDIVAGLWLELTGMETWCDDSGFTQQGDGEGNNIRLDGIALDHRDSHTDWIALDEKTKLRISTVYRGPRAFLHKKRLELRLADGFDIAFDENISIRQSLRAADIWQSFLTFSTRKPSYKNIIGLRLAVPESPEDRHAYALLTPGHREQPIPPRVGTRNVLLTKMKLGTRFGQVLSAWWGAYGKIETPIMLYTGNAYQDGAYMHVRLLTYLQTLEILHRELYGGSRRFPQDCTWDQTLAALRAAIPSQLPNELRKSISDGLSFQGSMNLIERLYDLYDRYPLCLGALFPNREAEMKALRDARNFLTHYGDHKYDRDFLFSPLLFRMSEKARLFVEICMLGALGFTDSEIKDLIRFFDPYSAAVFQARILKSVVPGAV